MIDVNKYIIKLLERNNEVTLPGVGGLYLSRTQTKLHHDNDTLYPATVSVTFNPFRLSDDGELRDEIAREEDLVKHLAEYEVQKFIIRIKQGLSRYQQFELPGIGVLMSDSMSNIRFKTASDFILNKANFGLAELIAKPSEPHKDSLAQEKKIIYRESEKGEKSVWKWLLVSLFIIIIISLLILLGVQYFLQKVQ
ncbi:hypothetical protein [Solitalea lacus]|uniref:HU domain-containing protein n=1 Tax=Solitalea lacus TaxID=2911172 RepID=UPI001EDA7F30|nr:hypothetical protein [Solitalea lacus]UKJ08944.1 hypothetical protein L2B55_07195 [Solitalea lacus]